MAYFLKGGRNMLKKRLGVLFLCTIYGANAEQLSPSSSDIIATWPVPDSSKMTYQKAVDILDRAQQLGSTSADIKALSQAISYRESRRNLNKKFTYIKASLLQRNHDFEAAKEQLVMLNTPQSKLLLASVYNNLGQFENSLETCKSLVSHTAHLVALTCMLDARFQQAPSVEWYQQLTQLRRVVNHAPAKVLEWVDQTLAFMALALNNPTEALTHLPAGSLDQASIATASLWAQAQLALGQYNQVIEMLGPVANMAAEMDDGILIMLAQAEQHTGKDTRWQIQAQQRIAMREWRKDWSHAAYIARYYLDVQPDADKAHHFAQINWQYAKGLEDKQLLSRTVKHVTGDK